MLAMVAAATSEAPEDKNKGKERTSRFKVTYEKTGVKLRYYKTSEFNKLTQEQKDELISHRKANGNYKGAWSGKPPKGGKDKKVHWAPTKAKVAAMIKDCADKREKEAEEQNAMRAELVSDLKGIISSEIATALAGNAGGAKLLRAA